MFCSLVGGVFISVPIHVVLCALKRMLRTRVQYVPCRAVRYRYKVRCVCKLTYLPYKGEHLDINGNFEKIGVFLFILS